MMLNVNLALVLAVLAPQEPDALQETLQRHKLTPHVAPLIKASTPKRVKHRKVKPPAMVTQMRQAGLLAYKLNLKSQLSGAFDAEPDSDFWFEFGDKLLLKKPKKVRPPRIHGLKEIERFFVDVERDMRKALDIGKPVDRSVPRLHALMEEMQRRRSTYAPNKDDMKLIDSEVRLANRVDIEAMWLAAKKVLLLSRVLSDPKLLKKLRKAPADKVSNLGGVTGTVVMDDETAYGRIVVGGPGRNEYECSRIDVLIDLGGDDVYRGNAGGAGGTRQFAVHIDLGGDDVYDCGNDALGSASYGIGILIDVAGNDKYKAGDRSCGFGAAGVGMFVDLAGNDELRLGAHSAGCGLMGYGICIDMAGTDDQTASDAAFGCGLPAGLGLFLDVKGNDKRGQNRNGKSAYLGMGSARGLIGVVEGGLGVCLDLDGDDIYAGGDLCGGAAEEGGVGIFVDALGDDLYTVRDLGLGAARHGGIGMFQDWRGKDRYRARNMSVASSTGGARVFFLDQGGDDSYEVSGAGIGTAGSRSLALFWDSSGKDIYRWNRGPDDHLDGGPSLGFLFDSGGGPDRFTRLGPTFYKGDEGAGKSLWRGAATDLGGPVHLFEDVK